MSIALVVVAYLCGAIPSGVLLARRAGVDVRRAGSGNIGATNVARTAGTRLGLLTLAADVAKGFVPVTIAAGMAGDSGLPAWAAVAAVVGHVFPPTLGVAGGKGVATALGASLALYPLAALPALAAFALTLAASGWVSLASMVAAGSTPVAVLWLGYPRPALAASVAMAALILVRHRENVARMIAGTEPTVVRQKQASPDN